MPDIENNNSEFDEMEAVINQIYLEDKISKWTHYVITRWKGFYIISIHDIGGIFPVKYYVL